MMSYVIISYAITIYHHMCHDYDCWSPHIHHGYLHYMVYIRYWMFRGVSDKYVDDLVVFDNSMGVGPNKDGITYC
jgi:hypothetical protein